MACAPDDAALLLHLSGNNATNSTVEDGTFTVFVDSSLNTHMAISVSPRDTVGDLKSKIRTEHHSCFPALGDIVIHAIKVKRRRFLYHLSDSMLVKSAFDRKMRTWFLHMDVSTLCTFEHQEEPKQGLSTPEIDVQMEIPESLEAVSCKQIDRTLKRLIGTAIDESEDSRDASKLCIISSDIGNLSKAGHLTEVFTNKADNPDDQLLHSQDADLEHRKCFVSEQTVQGNREGKTLNVSDIVGENPTSNHKASISAEQRAVDFNELQKCDTGMDLNVDSRFNEEVDFNGLKSEIVSSDAVPSKSKRRNRDEDEPADGSALEGLLVPVSGNKKGRKKKRKCELLELDNAPFKEDVAVNAFHTAEKSEFEKRADLNPQEDEDAKVDKSNCTPEDQKGENKSSSDLVKVKRKKKRVPKSREADHDNSSSYQEVVEGECNGKDSHSLKRTVDVTHMGNANVISEDGESKLSASCGMDEDLKMLPLMEASRDSEHATKKKRKKTERTSNHVAVAPEVPFVNHHNDSPGDELPSVSEHKNIANNGDITDQINGTKSLEKMNLYVETKKVDAGYTVSGVESLTSMEGIGIVVPEKEIVQAEDVMVSKDSKKKKSRKTESAVAERCIVPQAPNAFGSEHIEPMQERSTYNNEDGSTEKRKKSRKKVKNVDLEISAPDSQLLSPSTMKGKCEQNKQGSSRMQLTNDGALTSKPSQENSINPDMESIHEGAVEVDADHDDGCSNNGNITGQINGTKSSEQMNLYAETKQVDVVSGNESLTSMKGLGIDAVPEKEITRAENGMVSKDSKRKKSKKTESAVAEKCIVPQVEADRVTQNAVGLEHDEPRDERSTYSKKGGSTEKGKKSCKKVKNVDSEISMPGSQLLSPSTIKEKREQNKHGSPEVQLANSGALTSKPSQEKSINPNMESIHEGAVEGDADHDDGCSNNGDIADQINGTKSSEQMNLYAETKQVDAGRTLSGNESLISMRGIGIDTVPEKEITRAEDGMVSKDSKRKKSKKTESAVAGRCIVPQVEAGRVAPNAIGPEHIEPMDESTHIKKGGSTEKGKKSRKKVKNVDSEISMPDGQLLSPSTIKEKCEQNEQGSSKMKLTNSGALTSKTSQEKSINPNMESIHEVAAEGDADHDDGCSSSSDRVKEKEIRHPQKDSLNFIDYFVPGLSTDDKQVHYEGAASAKKTKKACTEQNSSAPPSEADVSGKVRKGRARQAKTDKFDIEASERTSKTMPRADVQQPSQAGPGHSFGKASYQELPSHGASNHVRSSKSRDSEEQSYATADASLSHSTASSYSDQNLDSSGSETLSSDSGLDDMAHGNGYLVASAARNNVGSIGRKMAQTRSVTAGRLSEIFKSSSTCRKAVLQASKSKHEQSKVDDDTDSPPVDTVAETQDSQVLTRLF